MLDVNLHFLGRGLLRYWNGDLDARARCLASNGKLHRAMRRDELAKASPEADRREAEGLAAP